MAYACGWLELEDEAYNGYFRKKETGDLNYTPQPGDLIIFVSTEYGCASHVGMVTAVDDSYIHTVEGNWDNQVSILERDIPNGDGKYIDDGIEGIAGYYSIRKLISMNQ